MTTPSIFVNELDYVTSEVNNFFMSLDHNSLLYNLHFLNAIVPLIAHTMTERYLGSTLEQTTETAKLMLNFARSAVVSEKATSSRCEDLIPYQSGLRQLNKDYWLKPGFYITNAPR